MADEAPVIETVPFAESLIHEPPLPALAIILFTLVVKGEALLVPILPFNEVRLRVLVLTVPVIAELRSVT